MTAVMEDVRNDPRSWYTHAHINEFRAVDERETAFTLFPRQARRLEKLGILGKGEHGGLAVLTESDEIVGRGLALPHITGAMMLALGADVIGERDAWGNGLANAGINGVLGNRLVGGAATAYDATHTAIGVGDTTTAFAASQTDLAAAATTANRYIQIADSLPTFATQVLTVVATFPTGNANMAAGWQEWAIGQNTASAGNVAITASMLNRKVVNLGTKTSAAAWQFTVTITIS